MKQFIKMIFAVIIGNILVFIFATIMFFVLCIMMAIGGGNGSSAIVSDNSILRISLDGSIAERAQADAPWNEMLGNEVSPIVALNDTKKALLEAAKNDKVKGVYLECGSLTGDFASLQELRKALVDYKKSGKFLIAYADQYSQGCYYVASVADKVLLNPYGMLDWHGLGAQPIFFKDVLAKLGIKFQVFKVGTYKSAVEPYILTGMSDANREQVTSYINDIWGVVAADVAKSRKLTEKQLNEYADQYITFVEPKDYVDKKLVDSLCYIDGVRDVLRAKLDKKKVKFISVKDLAANYSPEAKSEHIAVYYAIGNIVDKSSVSAFAQEDQIVGSKVVDDLDKLANDEDVKAVVLRINSGGGSAYASEQMWRAIQLLKKKKPVVVSMSGMAASGGYYMSCGANYIFAEPTTITGSIGIFGLIPDASELLTEKVGLHFDIVKTNEASDFGNMSRPFNATESSVMQAYVERGYQLFISRVGAGRKKTTAEVDSIGQGRVWTGNQALRLGLVDKLGTLEDAIAYAGKLAKINTVCTQEYPAQKTWMEMMMSDLKGESYIEREVKALLGTNYSTLMTLMNLQMGEYIQARIPYDPNIR